ncbi:MAG: TIGR01459 family HAD-type hydrolase [Rhizobiales bacterium]|nr:TIGR01459 family HAD-type hydrolase [Hyphomicrobiales bacterium]MBI3672089.1 TIGR01459 family HAD-type hydrolase [Hyphomicrobiales bacterium]
MRIDRLSNIASRFGGMLIDQFGVIHDGESLYPGALEVLRELKARSIPVAVMTNSGKRAEANRQRLIGMGIPRNLFVDAVSSGEVAYRSLDIKRAYLIGKDGENYGFDGVGFVERPEDAEVILILGTNAPKTTLDDYRELLRRLTVPAICCNPDRLMLSPRGLLPAPGAIASLYEELGGKVTWIGKPYPAIYSAACDLIGNPADILCIGDSAEHDVAGGRAAGLSTLLVMTGVSAGLDPTAVSPQPDFWMKDFRW